MIFPPYNKSETLASSNKLGSNVSFSRYRHKDNYQILIPSFQYVNTWLGASEIIYKFHYTHTSNFSILNIKKAFNTNFCACISWIEDGVVKRFKLWSNVGEVLYLPNYNGERITADYSIEVWSVDLPLLIGGLDYLNTSFLYAPLECSCNSPSLIINYSAVCLDEYIILADFHPDDPYTWTETCNVSLLNFSITFARQLNLLADDLTIHTFTLVKVPVGDGTYYTNFNIQQINSGLTSSGRLLLSGNTYLLTSTLSVGDYVLSFSGPVISLTTDTTYYALLADDGHYYLVSLAFDVDLNVVLNINQTRIV